MTRALMATRSGSLIVVATLLCATPAHANVGRVSITPDPATVTRGESTALELRLDEPAICVEVDPCEVVIDLSQNLPEGFSISPSIVTVGMTEWNQVVELTATLDDDAPDIPENAFTVATVVTSGSEYYNGFAVSVDFTVTEDVVEDSPDELAATGVTDELVVGSAVSVLLMAIASVFITRSRRRMSR